jgi:hypothetical protein
MRTRPGSAQEVTLGSGCVKHTTKSTKSLGSHHSTALNGKRGGEQDGKMGDVIRMALFGSIIPHS